MKGFPSIAALLVLAMTAAYAQQPIQGQGSQGGRQGRGGGQGGGQRGGGQGAQGGQDTPRDPSTTATPATASISGRVLSAETGRPLKRAQVTISGSGRGGRSTVTDDQGVYSVAGLSAGSYMITATKNGYVDAIFGQRHPLQAGTPLPLDNNQQANNVDLRLIRGGVITGRVLDEDGEPLMRAAVSIQRYQYMQGSRQLTAAGANQTDDRGVYRVFGLPPGDYYVSVNVAGMGQFLGRGMQAASGAAFSTVGGRGGRGFGGFGVVEEEPSGYAPTFYPGVVSVSDAGKVTVGPGQEVGSIDFQIQLVPYATVSGVIAGGDNGSPFVTVTLAPQDTNTRNPLSGTVMNGRTTANGAFTIPNVPPGHYLAIARSGGRQGESLIGVQQVAVNGQNIGGVAIMLQSDITMSGNITVETSGTPAPTDYSAFRIDAPEVNPLPFVGGPGGRGGGTNTSARAAVNGSFSVPNLVPGKHYVRITGQGLNAGMTTGTSWNLKSVLVNGLDVTDSGVDLKPGENLDSVTIVLTDRMAMITGTVYDGTHTPVPALTVIAFPSDERYWTPQSRWIQAGRTDQNGVYRMRALPPGEYLLLVTDNVEQGEWFDPSYLEQVRGAATRVAVNDGDQKTQDLVAPSSGS
jgi:protocatechuate 3,4-dioxygenase beta subunit